MEQSVVLRDSDHSVVPAAVHLCRLADAFIASLDVAMASRQAYRRALKAFFVWLSATGRSDRMDDLSRFDILAYKDALSGSKRVATANMYIFVIHRFFGWLEEQRIRPDITKGIKCFKKGQGHAKDCLTVDQVRHILGAIDRMTVAGMRDYAIVSLMARVGLRDIEIARARVGDVRMESGEAVLWVHGKGRAEADAFVVLVPEAAEPIRAWMAMRPPLSPNSPLFPRLSRRNPGGHMTSRSVSKIVKQAMRRVGIDSERQTPHSLRHTAISLAIAGGASLEQTQAMARHISPTTTMVYYVQAVVMLSLAA